MKALIYLLTLTVLFFAAILSMDKKDTVVSNSKQNNCYEWSKLSKENKVKLTSFEVKTGKKIICEG